MNVGFAIDVFVHDLGNGYWSACSTWNERTLPPRSTSEMMARLFDGPDLPPLVNGRPLVVTHAASHLPKVGFVHFHDRAAAAHRGQLAIAHGLANTMGHEPCGFERTPKVR